MSGIPITKRRTTCMASFSQDPMARQSCQEQPNGEEAYRKSRVIIPSVNVLTFSMMQSLFCSTRLSRRWILYDDVSVSITTILFVSVSGRL